MTCSVRGEADGGGAGSPVEVPGPVAPLGEFSVVEGTPLSFVIRSLVIRSGD